MAAFRFELEPVLRARRYEERRRQRVVADLEIERIAIEDRLRAHQRMIASGKAEQRGSLEGRVDIDELRGRMATVHRGMRDAQRLAVELAGVYRRLQDARAELAEAAKDRRAVELLKERRHEAWRRAEDKAETAAIDDIVAHEAARKDEP